MNFLKKAQKQIGKAVDKASSHLQHHEQTLVHGFILIDIKQARNLPDMEGWLAKIVSDKDVTDPFVDVRLGKAKLVKSSVVLNSLDPVWDESYRVEVCHFAEELTFEVRDKDHAYAEFIGAVRIPAIQLLTGNPIEGWQPIQNKLHQHKGDLDIRVQFVSTSAIVKTYEVDCYFPMHRNCNVTLYQDAHVPPNMPQFSGLIRPDGQLYQPASCWSDVYYTIQEARKIICITGWAVWDKLQLFRGQDLAIDSRTLGEILVDKSNQGVQVYVMVWSEKTSGELIGEKGVMGTHDMETFHFFKNTKVNCALTPRDLECNEFTDYLQNEFSTGAYTHHQKSIICDANNPMDPGRRRLVAFVGGLDLTGGRWDTPNHELFSTLLHEHRGDFRNSNAKSVPPEQGPREPWHDIHSKVEGPVAYDVFHNFYERWIKQGGKYGNLDQINEQEIDIFAPAPVADPSRVWNSQFFRSITSDSAIFDDSRTGSLNSKKGRMVDSSIAQAYIQMIRNAQNYIYIENQYFLGSAYCWLQNDDVNCHHTIPSEIAQKVVQKIHAGERFVAYILIPMFPEGDPNSAPIQEILAWQTRTIQMMYSRVGRAIREAGIPPGAPGSHPTDWLLFLCPGKRELPGEHLDRLDSPTEQFASIFRESLRFMIYVHSKMMIVDDTYIIVGSANINQRSLAGTRDTEMAVGCWQPAFTETNAFGDVHMFRMGLWAEHLKTTEEVFRYPNSLECVHRIKEMAFFNWTIFKADEPGQTPGHLLPYPLNVLEDGKIEYLDGVKSFPDFPSGAKIMGKISAVIPQKVTT